MLRRARIEKVIHNDQHNRFMTVLVTWLDMEGGFYDQESRTGKIFLSYSYISRSFGIQYYPLPGDIVLCGFLIDQQPIVIAFLTTQYYSKMMANNDYGYYFRNIVQGELAIKALQGNELYLDRKGSLKFIARDQSALTEDLRKISNKDATNANVINNYLTTLNDTGNADLTRTVDLTKQVQDIIKTEVTIGKVYDKDYKEEQKLNDKSIAVQVIGNKNAEQVFSLKINEEGEIELKRTDDKYNITIDRDGQININTKNQINMKAPTVEVEGQLKVKDDTGLNTGTFTTFTGTTVMVQNGIVTSIIP